MQYQHTLLVTSPNQTNLTTTLGKLSLENSTMTLGENYTTKEARVEGITLTYDQQLKKMRLLKLSTRKS